MEGPLQRPAECIQLRRARRTKQTLLKLVTPETKLTRKQVLSQGVASLHTATRSKSGLLSPTTTRVLTALHSNYPCVSLYAHLTLIKIRF